MSNLINGYGFPKLRVLDNCDNLVEEMDFQQTNSDGGFSESCKDEDMIVVLEKEKRIVKVYRGTRITFTLNYSQYIRKEDALKFQRLREYERVGFKIILIPHSDVLIRQFRVKYSGDDFEISIGKGGEYARTNKQLVFKWTTEKLERNPNWIDPDNINTPLPFKLM